MLLDNIETKVDMRIMGLYMFMTSRCTRRCEGCYYYRQDDYPTLPAIFSDKLIEKISPWWNNLLQKYGASICHITYVGGEPTLYLKEANKIAGELMTSKPDNLKAYVQLIYTNGDLFKLYKPEDFSKLQTRYNIGDDSLELAKEKIEFIKEIRKVSETPAFKFSGLVVVLNERNIARIEKLVRLAKDNDLFFKIYPFDIKVTDPDYKELLIETLHKILDICEEYENNNYNCFFHYIVPEWMRQESGYYCGTGGVMMDSDGSLRFCTRDRNTKVGTIWELDDPFPTIWEKAKDRRWAWYNPNVIEFCKDCEIRHVCQGGCANERMWHYGKLNVRPPLCEVYKAVLPRMIDLHKKNIGG